jgi:hypothetical protein
MTELRFDAVSWGSRYDPVMGRSIRYDRELRLQYRPETGDYLLSWIGGDGQVRHLVQEPPNRLAAVVVCNVTYDPATSLYTYAYVVSNLPRSMQSLQFFIVEAAAIQRTSAPDSTWASFDFTPRLRDVLSVRDGGVWSHVFGDPPGLPPGASAGPFGITSPNPPAVVRVAVRGLVPIQSFIDEEPPEDLLRVTDAAMRNWPVGWTIGPVAPEEIPAAPALRLEWLEAQLAVAEEEGWLGASEQARRVRVPLGEARAALQSGEPSRARAMLLRGAADIETIQDDSLLSEARALLLFHLGKVREAIR